MNDLTRAGVRVPCSTSNLGSGFDTLGLALDRYLQAGFEPAGSTLTVVRTGTLAPLQGNSVEEDLLVRSFVQTLASADAVAAGTLEVHSEIPVARGLGSSAAALVAGHDLARAVLGLPPDPRATFRFALAHEGHGDNAAPCALGGLRAVVQAKGSVRALALELSPDVGFAYAAPGGGLATKEARAALPQQVAHHTAVVQLGSLAALLRGLAVADPELIRMGVEDSLHVPHRLPLIVGAFGAMEAGYAAGAWAITISGSGTGLIAMSAPQDAAAVADAMRTSFSERDATGGSVGFALHPDFEGMSRVT